MQKIIECVPNFSEGRDLEVIRQITAAIESVEGVSLLNVDPGASTNRTVVTFAGAPDAAVEAAFRGIQKAAELIDMRKTNGRPSAHGRDRRLPVHPGEQRELGGGNRVREETRETGGGGVEDSGLSLRESGEQPRAF